MTERSTIVTPDLLGRLTRDTTTAALTRRPALVLWGLTAVVLLVGVVFLIAPSQRDHALTPLLAAVLFAVFFPLLVRRTTRRAVVAAYPLGSTVGVEVGEDSLRITTARGRTDVAYVAYRSVLERRSVVLLHLRGSQIFSVLPRELLDGEDVGRLRDRIGAAVAAS